MQTDIEQLAIEPEQGVAPADDPAPTEHLPTDHNPPDNGLKYDHELDLRSRESSHAQLLLRIPEGARVLELGCATGRMAAYLAGHKGCEVVGVDIDEAALEKAAPHCVQTLTADLDDPAWQEPLGEARFDVVLCADIIEHLKDPEGFLTGLRERLAEGGKLLASVPNVAHASIRLELLQGQFTYEDTGLLDRTHLHLLTHHSLMALLSRAGYGVDELSYTVHDVPDAILEQYLERAGLEPTPEALARLHAPEAVAYQYIVVARPRAPGEPATVIPEPHQKPLDESERVYHKLHKRLHETQLVAQRRQEVIEARDREAAQHQRQAEAKDRQLDELKRRNGDVNRLVQELRGQAQHQAQRIAYKDGRISELQQQNRALDRGVAELQEKTRAKDTRIKGLLGDKARLVEETHRLRAEVVRRKKATARLQKALSQLQERHAALHQVLSTRSWRVFRALTLPVRALRHLAPRVAYLVRNPRVAPAWFAKGLRLWRQGGLQGLRWHLAAAGQTPSRPLVPTYERWILEREVPSEPDPDTVEAFVAGLDEPPRFAIVMPVYEPRPEWLRAAIESVRAQSYPHWQLCIADDASPSAAIRDLLQEFSNADPRIRVTLREKNGHITAATKSALALAEHEWVGFMDHDDVLASHALYHVAREVVAHPEARLLYSDEDKIDDKGTRSAHYFKPDYNPDLMLSHNLLCHFSVYRRELVDQVGGLREGFDGAQDYDLALRCLATVGPEEVRHVPRILYHWRASSGSTASGAEAKPYAVDAAVRAVSGHLADRGVEAQVEPSKLIEGMLRVRYPVPDPAPRVSLIIPTRNGERLLRQCIDSVRARTDYPDYEILLIDNQSDEPAALDYLQQLENTGEARVLRYDAPFNYAAINNFAVAEASGDYLCFLNNDIEVIEGDWLREMVSQAARPEIGAVGARLLYPDGRLQHGGVITGLGGVAGHSMKYLSGEAKGYNARAVLVQNYSAVTAACMVVRREVFEQVDGFDAENLGVAFNDVDLCLRIREQGYRNLWTPYAELLHHESATRGAENTAEKQARFSGEIAYMKSRWGSTLKHDPAYNPNLTLAREDFSLDWHRVHTRTTP